MLSRRGHRIRYRCACEDTSTGTPGHDRDKALRRTLLLCQVTETLHRGSGDVLRVWPGNLVRREIGSPCLNRHTPPQAEGVSGCHWPRQRTPWHHLTRLDRIAHLYEQSSPTQVHYPFGASACVAIWGRATMPPSPRAGPTTLQRECSNMRSRGGGGTRTGNP